MKSFCRCKYDLNELTLRCWGHSSWPVQLGEPVKGTDLSWETEVGGILDQTGNCHCYLQSRGGCDRKCRKLYEPRTNVGKGRQTWSPSQAALTSQAGLTSDSLWRPEWPWTSGFPVSLIPLVILLQVGNTILDSIGCWDETEAFVHIS